MHGYSKITDKEGVEHILYFGMQAVEEFAIRLEKHLSENPFKISVDLIYAGLANYKTKNDIPPLSYKDVYEMVEDCVDFNRERFDLEYEELSKAFWESQHGRTYANKLEETKKKIEEEIEALTELQVTTGMSSEDLG